MTFADIFIGHSPTTSNGRKVGGFASVSLLWIQSVSRGLCVPVVIYIGRSCVTTGSKRNCWRNIPRRRRTSSNQICQSGALLHHSIQNTGNLKECSIGILFSIAAEFCKRDG